jgi:adenylate cyclase
MPPGFLKRLRTPVVAALLVGALVGLAVIGLRLAGQLEGWELLAYDWCLRARTDSSRDHRLVMLGISETDIQQLGRWPLTDDVMAQMLNALLVHKPRAIGVDIYRDLPVPPGEKRLAAVLGSHPNVVMVMKFGHDAHAKVGAPAVLRDTDQIGFNDLIIDADGVVRRGLLFLDDGREVAFSFGLRLALQYLQHEGVRPEPDPAVPEHLRLGPVTFRPLGPSDGGYVGADARGYQFLLDFQGGRHPFASYTLTELLRGHIPPNALRDKLVLVGVTAVSVPDVFQTPYSSILVGEQRGTYGVLLHAEVASQLLRAALDGRAPLAIPRELHEMAWIALWGLLGGTIGVFGRTIWRFLVLTGGGLLLLAAIVYAAFLQGWWIPLIPPALSWIGAAALLTAYMTSQEKKQRAVVMQLFSRYVSPEIAEALWRQREQFWEGGRPRSQSLMVTVLFSDLEGFTSLAEKLPPQELMDWLNSYVDIMARLVMKHGGVVDDYFGDAIKANFGVPFARTSEAETRQDARNALLCALAMGEEMHRLNTLWHQEGRSRARIRVGIHTGPVVAGSLGTTERLKYTTMGDTVNIAARLESFEKDSWEPLAGEPPCRILIGESTLQLIADEFRTVRMGDLSLKGKFEKVTVYRVLDRAETPPSQQLEEVMPCTSKR